MECAPGTALHLVIAEKLSVRPTTALHREYFHATAPAMQVERGCSLVLQRSGLQAEVNPEESVVQIASRAGVELPVSCGTGICGACTIRIIEGECEHRDEHRCNNLRNSREWIAPCMSGCRSALGTGCLRSTNRIRLACNSLLRSAPSFSYTIKGKVIQWQRQRRRTGSSTHLLSSTRSLGIIPLGRAGKPIVAIAPSSRLMASATQPKPLWL
ncbi:Toluene-4-sulfonate monooxygenase system reductase subunit TsaB1 [compost metagenome]